MTLQEIKDFINNLPEDFNPEAEVYIFDTDSNIYDSIDISTFSGIWSDDEHVCIKFA
nr:MAG TPA: hypothetical protein [Caudoviricetes sp.]DAY27424.1 MAG TPA: hypothetical protein [Caudoviricetes sp.]